MPYESVKNFAIASNVHANYYIIPVAFYDGIAAYITIKHLLRGNNIASECVTYLNVDQSYYVM